MTADGAADLAAFVANADSGSSFFREMADALPVAVYTTDAEGTLTYFNVASAKAYREQVKISAEVRRIKVATR